MTRVGRDGPGQTVSTEGGYEPAAVRIPVIDEQEVKGAFRGHALKGQMDSSVGMARWGKRASCT